MELQAVLVLCGVGVAGIAVLLLMGLFSASCTSYEEAIAQQRRATSEFLALAGNKNKSKKINKKANKKLAKKEKKENATAQTGSEPESEAPAESGVEDEVVVPKAHVEFDTSVIVESPSDNPPNSSAKIRKRGKDSKIKPILINKEDPSCVSDPNTAATPIAEVSNHFEEIQPKDDFELLHSTLEKAAEKSEEKKEEIVEKKESKASKQIKEPKQSQPEPVKDELAPERQSLTEAPLEQRKVKKTEKKAVTETVDTVEDLLPQLNIPQPGNIAAEKVVQETLQAAPAPSPPAKSKKKKAPTDRLSLIGDDGGVAASDLLLLVHQATLTDVEIQKLTEALLNKAHGLLPEHSEWTGGPNDAIHKFKKQLNEKKKALEEKTEAYDTLLVNCTNLRTSLNAERASANAARTELRTQQTHLQRLVEERKTLLQEKQTLQNQINEREAQVAQLQSLELHTKRLSESEAAVRAELSARILEVGQARCDATAAREEAMLVQQHQAQLAQNLQEANLAFADLEQQRQIAVHAEQLAKQELRQAQARLTGLTDLQNDVQRLTSRAQTAESNAEKLKEDMEKQKEELTKEIACLQEQLGAGATELAELKQLQATPSQNGLLSNSVNEEKEAAELAKVESLVESLRNELVSAQESSAEQKAQLANLQEQLAQYRDKNNELRTKNWKVMEALQTAEKALATRAAPAMPASDALAEAVVKAREQHFVEVADLLRSVCPTAAPHSAKGSEWLQEFAENLKGELLKIEAEKQQLENDRKRQESEFQKKIEEKELAAKEIERRLQQEIQDKELESKRTERDLLKELEQELSVKKEMENKLQQLQQEERDLQKKLDSELQKRRDEEIVVSHPEDDSKIGDLVAQNENLQGLVEKYKGIIDDTEGVLSRLQQQVTLEESRWTNQLAEQERELKTLRLQEPLAFAYSCIEKTLPSIMAEMQNKIDTLQVELEKYKLQANNHSHTFADAERIAEERLMSGCAGSHEVEVRNGPLQEQIALSEI